MDQWIHIHCPWCAVPVRAPFQLLGKSRHCPKCSRELIVNLPAPGDEGPVLVGEEQDAAQAPREWLRSI